MTILVPEPGRSFESVFNTSGLPALVAHYGDWFSYNGSPRAQIFRRNQSLVHDLDSMIRLMRCAGGDREPRVTWSFIVTHCKLLASPGGSGEVVLMLAAGTAVPRQHSAEPSWRPCVTGENAYQPWRDRPVLGTGKRALNLPPGPLSSGTPCPVRDAEVHSVLTDAGM